MVLLSEQPWPQVSLQLIGDALLAAVRGGVDGELARSCVDALGERSWAGDRRETRSTTRPSPTGWLMRSPGAVPSGGSWTGWLSDELMTRWHGFANERQRVRARSWLAAEGYAPMHDRS